jgi:hypothetical protein
MRQNSRSMAMRFKIRKGNIIKARSSGKIIACLASSADASEAVRALNLGLVKPDYFDPTKVVTFEPEK